MKLQRRVPVDGLLANFKALKHRLKKFISSKCGMNVNKSNNLYGVISKTQNPTLKVITDKCGKWGVSVEAQAPRDLV